MGEAVKEKALVVFQDKKIRRSWHNDEWFYSVVDVVAVLMDQSNFQDARKELEKETGESVVSKQNFLSIHEKKKLEKKEVNKSVA